MITIDPIKRPPRKSSTIDKDALMKEIDQKFSNLIDGAPETLDTIKELAAALKDNAGIVDVLNESIGSKLSKTEAAENYATKAEIPTKLSQLENDANYATTNQIPTNISQFNNDCGFVQSSRVDTIETSVSSLGSQMITGDIKSIKKVTALPDNPDSNTLYIITS